MKEKAARAVNTELIELYWRIGDYLHRKIESDGWAKGTVALLAAYLTQREPCLRGFSPQNLWRMRQFFVAYRDFPKISPLLRELPWSSYLHILSRAKRPEEREFYLRLATQNRWPVREVARQIDSALFERAVLSPPKLSTALKSIRPLQLPQSDSFSLRHRRRRFLRFAVQSFTIVRNKTRQGYAHRSILKPAGYFFVVSKPFAGDHAL